MNPKIFRDIARDLYLEANYNIRPDIKKALQKAYSREKKRLPKQALAAILKNAYIARCENIAICQDTGYPVFFVKIGKKAPLPFYQIEKELNKGIKEATLKGPFRYSVIKDPLERCKRSPNVPAIFHYEFINSDSIEITLLVKGFGSENKSCLYLLNPNTSIKEITDIVVKHIKDIGSSACPPYIIGIGVGATSDEALILSKKATLLDIDKKSKDILYAKLERDIFKQVNKLSIGALGLGGDATCLGVRILHHATHIAGLPLAISVGCHATRSSSRKLKIKN